MKISIKPGRVPTIRLEQCEDKIVKFPGDGSYYLVMRQKDILQPFDGTFNSHKMILYNLDSKELMTDAQTTLVEAVFELENIELKEV